MDGIDKMIYRPTGWIVDPSGETVAGLGIEIRNVRKSAAIIVNYPYGHFHVYP